MLVEALRKHPCHIRKLSEELSLIPSTTMRTLRKLEEENVVEGVLQGKNKVYGLKNTPEAKTYLYMVEHYKLISLLQDAKMRRIITLLQEQTGGELIVLYGSYAKGLSTEKSDVDLYIETYDEKKKESLQFISEKLSIKMGKLDKETSFAKELMKEHVIVQGVERFYQLMQ